MVDDPIPPLKRAVGDAIARALDRFDTAGAAVMMRTETARVSDLRRGELKRFSLETLIRYAVRLRIGVAVQLDQPGARRAPKP